MVLAKAVKLVAKKVVRRVRVSASMTVVGWDGDLDENLVEM